MSFLFLKKSDLLHQVSLTDIELKQILSGAHSMGEHQQSSVGSKNYTPLSGSPQLPPSFSHPSRDGVYFSSKTVFTAKANLAGRQK